MELTSIGIAMLKAGVISEKELEEKRKNSAIIKFAAKLEEAVKSYIKFTIPNNMIYSKIEEMYFSTEDKTRSFMVHLLLAFYVEPEIFIIERVKENKEIVCPICKINIIGKDILYNIMTEHSVKNIGQGQINDNVFEKTLQDVLASLKGKSLAMGSVKSSLFICSGCVNYMVGWINYIWKEGRSDSLLRRFYRERETNIRAKTGTGDIYKR